MTETVKRIVELMEWRGDNAHTLEVNAKLPTSSVYSWKNDRFQPSTEAIIKIARHFNVSADYLLCLIDDPKPLVQADLTERHSFSLSTELAELSKEKRFVDTAKVYKELPDEYRERVFGLIVGIAVGLGMNVDKILKS